MPSARASGTGPSGPERHYHRNSRLSADPLTYRPEWLTPVKLSAENSLAGSDTSYSPLHEALHEYLGESVLIPYDHEERRRKFVRAYAELAHHIRRHLERFARLRRDRPHITPAYH